MSVLLDTSLGALTIDLEVDAAPLCSANFLKLCKLKAYAGCLFYNVAADFVAQTGDPTGTGRGGCSAAGLLQGEARRLFTAPAECGALSHDRRGTLSMAAAEPGTFASQFVITTRDACPSLDSRSPVFGRVVSGWAVLNAINAALTDESGRPYLDIRITHTHVLVDPFPDPPGLVCPPSPVRLRPSLETAPHRLDVGEDLGLQSLLRVGGRDVEAEAAARERRAAEGDRTRAVLLEMTGDLPSADAAPPENVLFVAKLNPVTRGEDLAIIFARFGEVVKADVIRDQVTGESLCYAFVTFADKRGAEGAYGKMNNVLVDERRIKVDFSQSVARLWGSYRGGGRGGRGGGRGGAARPAPPPPSAGAQARAGFDERRGGLQLPIRVPGGGGGRGEGGRGEERNRRHRSRSRSPRVSGEGHHRHHHHRHHHHQSGGGGREGAGGDERREREATSEVRYRSQEDAAPRRERSCSPRDHRRRERSRSRSRSRDRARGTGTPPELETPLACVRAPAQRGGEVRK
jgi:peptidyl-prolyl cis-trans isomerase-like 4